MRYRSNRQYLYPVLRPDSDDYGLEHTFIATCDPPEYDPSDGMLSINIRFELNEPRISEAVQSHQAKCAAMVYCSSTLYRGNLDSSPGEPFVVRGRIPVSRLKNRVEIHPVVLAEQAIIHSTDTAHPEYGGQPSEIPRLAPLATDLNWAFYIDSDVRPVRSIFRLRKDDSGYLNDGEFDVNIDLTSPYVSILLNSTTFDAFNAMRKDNSLALPTVFTSALLAVLCFVKENPEETEDDKCEWLDCVRTQLRKHGIEIGGPGEDGPYTPFLAAQRLLEAPFRSLLVEWSTAPDDQED